MEQKSTSTKYFADLSADNEQEVQTNKKAGQVRRGFYSSYTHFITIPLLGENIKKEILSLNV